MMKKLVGLLFSLFFYSYAYACSISNGPYIQSIEQTRATITWHTDVGMDAKVMWGADANYGSSVYYDSGGILGFFSKTVHIVRLANLNPASYYHYKVKSCDFLNWFCEETPDSWFSTAVPTGYSFRFVVYGNTRTGINEGYGGGTNSDHQKVADTIRNMSPDFIINAGDLANNGASSGDWSNFFTIEAYLLRKVSIFPVRGEHDAFDGGRALSGDTDDNQLKKYFFTTFNQGEDKYYYMFKYGNAWFVAFDTSKAGLGADTFKVGSEQYTKVDQMLAYITTDPNHGPIFAMTHYSPFSSAGGTPVLQQNLVPLFQKYGVDFVFSAHEKNYERIKPINGVNYIVTGGGGGPLSRASVTSLTASSATALSFVSVSVSNKSVLVEAMQVGTGGSSSKFDEVGVEDVTENDYTDPSYPRPKTMAEEAEMAGGCDIMPGRSTDGINLLILIIPALLFKLWRRNEKDS